MSRSRILSSVAAAFVGVVLLGACGGSSSPTETVQPEQANETAATVAPADDSAAADAADPDPVVDDAGLPPVCDLLSIADVELLTGQVVIDVSGMDNGDNAGVCEWEFEPLPESRGALAGTSPSILLQTFPDTETYDIQAESPDALFVNGVGDGALTFNSGGRFYFSANGRSALVSSILAFESGEVFDARTQELAALVAAGL